MKNQQLEILAIAPHPDDAEIFCGGFLALMAEKGHAVGILDLTKGELASQGTIQIREQEAKAAGHELGLSYRGNLGLPDGGISDAVSFETSSQFAKLVQTLRMLRPELVLAPFREDRHPDHRTTSQLATKAFFYASLQRYLPELGAPHRGRQLLYYQMRQAFRPSFVVDISSVTQKKLAAIKAHKSQVEREAPSNNEESSAAKSGTLISSPLSLHSIEARDNYFGAMIGVSAGEPFLINSPLSIPDPLTFFREHSLSEALLFPEVL